MAFWEGESNLCQIAKKTMHKIAWLADLFCCKPQPTTAKLDLPFIVLDQLYLWYKAQHYIAVSLSWAHLLMSNVESFVRLHIYMKNVADLFCRKPQGTKASLTSRLWSWSTRRHNFTVACSCLCLCRHIIASLLPVQFSRWYVQRFQKSLVTS